MIQSNEEERKVRIVLSKNPIAAPSVAITPIKSNRVPQIMKKKKKKCKNLN